MQKELLYDDLEFYEARLANLESESLQALKNTYKIDDIKEKVVLQRTNLINQITDPSNPGLGDRAKRIIPQIEETLGVELTKPSGTSKQVADFYHKTIDTLLAQKLSSLREEEQNYVAMVESSIKDVEEDIDQAKNSDSVVDDQKAIERSVKVYNQIGEKIKGIVDSNVDFFFNPVTAANIEIGKISHSLRSAMQPENREARWITIALSCMIDLLVPIMILILTPVNRERRKKRNRFPLRQHTHTSNSTNQPNARID